MATIDVPIGERGELIRIEARGDAIRLSRRGVWEQRLSREEAWRLAEAIEAVATAPDDERD